MSDPKLAFGLRHADQADYEEIAEIWHSSASLEGVSPPIMPTLADLRARVDVEIEKGWSVTVAIADSGLIGVSAVNVQEAVLDQLFVRPDVIGSGVGLALLQNSMRSMPDGFILHTASTNLHARKFYERRGLSFMHEGSHPRTGHLVCYYGWSPG